MQSTNQINSNMISRIFARAKAGGSSATTLTGACKYILAHPKDHILKAAPKSAADARDDAAWHSALDVAKLGDTVQCAWERETLVSI